MSLPPWHIYAQQLYPLRHGYPLWFPREEDGTILIGDVGWFRSGTFHPIFNSTHREDEAVNFVGGVPEGFEVFNIRPSLMHRHRFSEMTLVSKSVTYRGLK